MISYNLLKQQELIFVDKIQPLTIEQVRSIINIICEHFGLEYEELFTSVKIRKLSVPRMWCYYFLYHIYEMYSTDLSLFFDIHHSSVLHGYKTIQDELDSYKESLLLYHNFDENIKIVLNKDERYEAKPRKKTNPRKNKKPF